MLLFFTVYFKYSIPIYLIRDSTYNLEYKSATSFNTRNRKSNHKCFLGKPQVFKYIIIKKLLL